MITCGELMATLDTVTCCVCHVTCLCLAEVYDLLKENLMTRDDAVIGEAAGLAMGLVMVGSRSETAIEDMTNVSLYGGWVGLAERQYTVNLLVFHTLFLF